MIAVVDDGVDVSRADLRERIAVNSSERPGNGVDDDRNGLVDDAGGYDFFDLDPHPAPAGASGDPSHGTMMAILALHAAVGTVSDPGGLIRILPLRVADDRAVDTGAVAGAIRYAGRRNGRSVVNLSLGTIRTAVPQALSAAIAQERNVVFVVSAGNQGRRLDDTNAGLCRRADNVVCVAAVDSEDRLSVSPRASNFGTSVDLAAAGVGVGVTSSQGSRRLETGSSLAAASISGVAAALWSAAPELSAAEIPRALCAGARSSDALGDSVRCGIVDAAGSLRAARSNGVPREVSSISPRGAQ